MVAIVRIEPPLELDTPRGRAWAHFLIDYRMDASLVWVCFQRDTGECWSYSNELVRLPACETTGTRTRPPSQPAGSPVEGGSRAGGAVAGAGGAGGLQKASQGCDLAGNAPGAARAAEGGRFSSTSVVLGRVAPTPGTPPTAYSVTRGDPDFPLGRVVTAKKRRRK